MTDPGSQPVGSAREFWIYESNQDGLGTSGPFAVDGVHYFPEAMPTNGEDFFWIADPSYNLSAIQYRPSLLPKVPHPVPNIPIPRMQSGQLILDLPFEHFDQQFAPNWEFVFRPTFMVTRSVPGQTYGGKLRFIIQHVCFRMIDQPPYMQILPRDGKLISEIVKEHNFAVANSGTGITLEKLYTNQDHAPYAEQCSNDGGTIATSLRTELNFQNNGSADAQIEFSGMKVRYLTFE
ncbi:hypothetical protein [Oligoflexus tunisiensis]|uniref:hypothetical protein n=1 Tax=Oligoflexus tunisiensis TaxID=708132 RepID=UPI00159F041B|nr:hypothetical protein [Oligoflexus tunisiensis]